MAREKMVTRTIVSFEVKVLGINLVDGTAVTSEYEISGNFKDNADMLKFIKKNYDNEQLVNAAIASVEEKEKLFGMTEAEFMKYAKELPPRKVYEQ